MVGMVRFLATCIWAVMMTAGCSSGSTLVDAGPDDGFDAGLDAGFDAGDPGGDSPLDAGNDPGPGDDGLVDAGQDAGEDAGPDAGDGLDGQAGTDAGDGDPGGDPATEGWRSVLYPEDWTPAFEDAEGRFLHDFSYAGYRYGEVPLPDIYEPLFDAVSAFGADNSGSTDSTASIQATIDAAEAAGGGVVYLPLGTYRLDGELVVDGSGVVLRGDGPSESLLYFPRDQGMSNLSNIRFQGNVQTEGESLLAQDAENRASTIALEDASFLAVGDDVQVGWVITDEFVAEHGMDGTWVSFNGQWKPFFRRVVTAVDLNTTPHTVQLDVPIRYPALTRDGASLRKVSGFLEECGAESLGLSNAVAYSTAWTFDRAHVLEFNRVKDCWIRDVHSFDSPSGEDDYHLQSGGIIVRASKRVTVVDCRMEKAQHRGGGGNGYLFEVTNSSEVLFKDSVATAGRHNFIQNWDFGTTGCVFLRCTSRDGRMLMGDWDPLGVIGYCEYHHSLATANLVDACQIEDGWIGYNRHDESSGAGHSAAQNVYWNTHGGGTIKSYQYGWGYVIGTNDMTVKTDLTDIEGLWSGAGTDPEDWVESSPDGSSLVPESLYEDQRRLRLGL